MVQYRWVSRLKVELQMQSVAGEQHCLVYHWRKLEWELLNLRKLRWGLQALQELQWAELEWVELLCCWWGKRPMTGGVLWGEGGGSGDLAQCWQAGTQWGSWVRDWRRGSSGAQTVVGGG